MQAVILAAGLGTRMGELTKNRPKPLLTIENKTLIEHNLAALPAAVDEVVLVVGYLKEQIQSLVGEKYHGRPVRYVEQTELRGTGHALSLCRNILQAKFLVTMGDDLYSQHDLDRLAKCDLGLLAWELKTDDLEGARQALVQTDARGFLVEIIERQPACKGGLVNCGAYVIDERYFDLPLIPAGNQTAEFGLPQTFVQLAKQGAPIEVVRATWWHKVASPEDLEKSN